MNLAFKLRRRHRRRGISLIEVLMSIFIIAIGLLGVAALLPLGQTLANRGATADRASAAGKAALSDFSVRGMDNPALWLTAGGAAVSVDPTGNADPAKPLQPIGPKAYCIDPRGVARTITANFPNGGTPSMPRVTLRSAPAGAAMAAYQADEAFTIHDDLVFTVDDNDQTLPPAQFMEATSERRFSNNEFSWLATVTRPAAGDRYTVSVAVLQGRGNAMAATDEVNVTATILGSGFAGGEIRLAGNQAVIETLRPGHWIMLSTGNVFRWYRVISAGVWDATSNWRELTINGQDWDIAAAPNGLGSTAQATIFQNATVVGVYERTVRLEPNSPWFP